jgi:hypothetical protein
VFLAESSFASAGDLRTPWIIDGIDVDFAAPLWSRSLDERIAREGAERVLRSGGLVLHASAVRVDDSAYVFPAHSGTGKSTTAGRLSPPARIIADDQCVLMPRSSRLPGAWACLDVRPGDARPRSRRSSSRISRWACLDVRPGDARPVIVAAVYLLERGPRTRVEAVSRAVAFRRILSHLVLAPADAALHGLAMDAVASLLAEVPVRIARVSLDDLSLTALDMGLPSTPGCTHG